MSDGLVLVTGATGYVGGRLIPRLVARGWKVRAMARSLAKIGCRPWAGDPAVEIVEGDVLDRNSLKRAAAGCDACYYLVHSMNAAKGGYADADREAAANMVAAADEAGLERIVYLSGLGDPDNANLSPHLRSRHEVEAILHGGTVPVTVFRAAMILGSGSASFEILRYLTERLPVMITPRWVHTPCQPIAIEDVLGYLEDCLDEPRTAGETFDIGGSEVLAYQKIIDIFADAAGLRKRLIIPVPLLTPTLSAYWIHLITPVPASIAVPLTQGLGVPVVCRDERILEILPRQRITCHEAVRRALRRLDAELAETCWTDAGRAVPPEWARCGDADYAGGTIFSCGYRVRLRANPEDVWTPVVRIGGETGYYFGELLWKVRGGLDRLAGGVGLRRGRRHPDRLRVGEALDFWRVLELDPPHRLVLLAEMKMPGEAFLEILVTPAGDGITELSMRSRFLPRGLPGLAYWYGLYPFHQWIFKGMLRKMAESIGRPVIGGPDRFTRTLPDTCTLTG
jgi:uncharacterized protein YbjT (DUF2867 family)